MNILGEIRRAGRVLVRSRSYSIVAVATLALGIGANTAIFSMADAVVNRPFPFPELRRIVAISSTIPRIGAARYPVSPADFFDWSDRNRVFSALAAHRPWNARFTAREETQDLKGALVSPGFFRLIGVAPLQGRVFSPEGRDDERARVIVSYGFWQQRLGADPAAVGRPLVINGLAHTIAGVMPKQFNYPSDTDVWALWLPAPDEMRAERAAGTLSVLGRLAPRVSLAAARAEMSAVASDLAARYPTTNAGRGADVMLLSDSADPYAIRYMTVISAAVAFLLLLACANVVNLQLVRCAARRREFALESALGAGRWPIARQLLLEGVGLSLAGALLGIPIAAQSLELIRRSVPQLVARHLPGLPYAELNATVLAWMLAAAIVTGVVFTIPAVLQAWDTRLAEALKEGGRALAGGGRRLRSLLVVSEIAFALLLLAAAGAITRSFRSLEPERQGFRPAGVYTFSLRAPEHQYAGPTEVRTFYREALRQLAARSEFSSVAAISELPALANTRSGAVVVEGQAPPPPDRPQLAELRIASPGYLAALGIPVTAGRDLDAHDDAGSAPVAIITRAAARRFWPGREALGQRLRIAETGWLTVVGIAGDVNHFFLDEEIRPAVYVSCLQFPVRSLSVVVKPARSVDRAAAAARSAVRAVDPGQPVSRLQSFSALFSDLAGGVGLLAALVGSFAILSLVLAAAGIYAVMHYSVAQRTREFGIRIAMGARAADVWKLVLTDALRLVGIALALALPAVWAGGRALSTLLAGIVGLDFCTLIAATLVVVTSTILAAIRPAHRATRVDPLVAIHSE